MDALSAVIGVDVGGTNTDAAIIELSPDKSQTIYVRENHRRRIIGKSKTQTTSDVKTGVKSAIHLAIKAGQNKKRDLAVKQVNIGTTHFINALVEGRDLQKVAVIRLCGTSSKKVPPFSGIPNKLLYSVKGTAFLVNGGYQFDGSEITPFQEEEIRKCIQKLKEKKESNIVVSGIFSPVWDEQEKKVEQILQHEYPAASFTLSHKIGGVGLLERENAAILNESIKPLSEEMIKTFRGALDELGLKCPMYLTQNDGTIISEEKIKKYPVLTFASGATNSMRGAAFLANVEEAIVVDIGGTTTDVGLLQKGFPREASSEVMVGGVRTNFRMPDVISIGLGGGSYVTWSKTEDKRIRVGPQSAGYNIEHESLIFTKPGEKLSSKIITATDIAVAAGFSDIGNEENTKHLEDSFVAEAANAIKETISICIDKMRFNDRKIPMILVGGGSIITGKKWYFDGISEIITPEHYDVANAIGAGLSKISSSVDKVVDLCKFIDLSSSVQKENEQTRIEQLQTAGDDVIANTVEALKQDLRKTGVVEETLTVVEKDCTAVSYIPGDTTRIKVKVVGDLTLPGANESFNVPKSLYTTMPETGSITQKQIATSTGNTLLEEFSLKIQPPNIDSETGEWIISEYDIECLAIGAGILGCGGGGSPHIGKLLALDALKAGRKIKVVNPCRYLKDADAENDLVTIVAYMGAPIIIYEKLVAGIETSGALHCMQDLYSQGKFKDGHLQNAEGIDILEKDGIRYINDYKRTDQGGGQTDMGCKKIVAIMSIEIGGLNCMEPLIVGAELGLPVLDCDGMGRSFPEIQMFSPFIYGSKSYPSTVADDKGRRAVVLYADGPKTLENHFRETVVSMGCSAGVVLSHFNKTEVLNTTVQHSISRAWGIGNAVLMARNENRSPVEAVVKIEHGQLLIDAKVTDVIWETTGGFNRGKIFLDGIDEFAGKTVEIDIQNEFLIVRDRVTRHVMACVPDLVTVMDIDTAQPITTDEIKFGIRVSVVGMRVSPLMSTERALNVVGPAAFGYNDVVYKPVGEYVDHDPVAPK